MSYFLWALVPASLLVLMYVVHTKRDKYVLTKLHEKFSVDKYSGLSNGYCLAVGARVWSVLQTSTFTLMVNGVKVSSDEVQVVPVNELPANYVYVLKDGCVVARYELQEKS